MATQFGTTELQRDRQRKRRRPSAFGALLDGTAGQPARQDTARSAFGSGKQGARFMQALTPQPTAMPKRADPDPIRSQSGPLTGMKPTPGEPPPPPAPPSGSQRTDTPATPPPATTQPRNDDPILYPGETMPGGGVVPPGYIFDPGTQRLWPAPNAGGEITGGGGGTPSDQRKPNAGPSIHADPMTIGSWWIQRMMRDPYDISDAYTRQGMETANLAHNVAASRIRADQLGSGAAGSGVARGLRGQEEIARGSEMARIQREGEQYRQAMGDKRLREFLLPLFQYALQERAIAAGVTPPPASSSTSDALQSALPYVQMMIEWWRNRDKDDNPGGGGGGGGGIGGGSDYPADDYYGDNPYGWPQSAY